MCHGYSGWRGSFMYAFGTHLAQCQNRQELWVCTHDCYLLIMGISFSPSSGCPCFAKWYAVDEGNVLRVSKFIITIMLSWGFWHCWKCCVQLSGELGINSWGKFIMWLKLEARCAHDEKGQWEFIPSIYRDRWMVSNGVVKGGPSAPQHNRMSHWQKLISERRPTFHVQLLLGCFCFPTVKCIANYC